MKICCIHTQVSMAFIIVYKGDHLQQASETMIKIAWVYRCVDAWAPVSVNIWWRLIFNARAWPLTCWSAEVRFIKAFNTKHN